MDDARTRVQNIMRQDLREAVAAINRQSYKADGSRRAGIQRGSPRSAWGRFARCGFLIDEAIFQQWRGQRAIPLAPTGDTAEAFINADLVRYKEDGSMLVDPAKWRELCRRAAEPTDPLHITYDEHGEVDMEFSDPKDIAIRDFLNANSILAARKRRGGKPRATPDGPRTDTVILSSLFEGIAAQAGSQPRVRKERTVPLPHDFEDDVHWMPFGSAPSTCYWYWRWGITKDQLRVFIHTHAQWSVDYKHGFVDINDMAAVRWLYATPLADKFRELAQSGDETRFRYGMIKVMARLVGAPEPDFTAFEAAMRFVKRKVEDMRARELPMEVTVKQLHAWYQASEMD